MALKGVPKSPEHRAKIAAANIGKRHSEETKAKMRAAKLGKAKSLETRARMSQARKGMVFSDETRARMSASAKERAADPDQRKRLADVGRLGGWGRSGKSHSADARLKMSAARLGKEPNWPRDKRVEYNGHRFRSSWEVRVARALDALGIKWEYEPKRFHFGDQTYRPDFYLPDEDVYWEVKGYFTSRAQRAVRLFRERVDVPLVVINKAAMLMLERAVNKAA
jgi:hypothetical protein